MSVEESGAERPALAHSEAQGLVLMLTLIVLAAVVVLLTT